MAESIQKSQIHDGKGSGQVSGKSHENEMHGKPTFSTFLIEPNDMTNSSSALIIVLSISY